MLERKNSTFELGLHPIHCRSFSPDGLSRFDGIQNRLQILAGDPAKRFETLQNLAEIKH